MTPKKETGGSADRVQALELAFDALNQTLESSIQTSAALGKKSRELELENAKLRENYSWIKDDRETLEALYREALIKIMRLEDDSAKVEKENAKLRECLAVAERALRYYASPAPYPAGYESIRDNAEEALEKMKQVAG